MAAKDESFSSYEIVFAIEATSNLVAHWDAIKKHYLIPIVQHFHKLSLTTNDTLSTSSNLYGLVLFYAADITPDSLTTCLPPVKNHVHFLKQLEVIDFYGGGAEHCSFIAEGLATAAQLFGDMNMQNQMKNKKKFCFVIANTPPYEMPVVESLNYLGLNCQKVSEKLREMDVSLSIICPHIISELKNLFVSINDVKPPIMNYAQDKRHLVLLSDIHLAWEKEAKPLTEDVTQEIIPVKMELTPSNDIIPDVGIKDEVVSSTTSLMVKPEPNPTLPIFSASALVSTSNAATVSNQVLPNASASGFSSQNVAANTTTYQSEQVFATTGSVESSISVLPKTTNITPNFAPKLETKPPFELAKKEAQKVLDIVTTGKPHAEFDHVEPNNEVIWKGTLEWTEKRRYANGKVTHSIPCQILQSISAAAAGRINTSNWSPKLTIQMIPQSVLTQSPHLHVYLKTNRQVLLNFTVQQTQQMANLFSQKNLFGLVQHLPIGSSHNSDGKIITVFFRKKEDRGSFFGLIPNDGAGFLNALKVVITNMQRQRASGNTSIAGAQTNQNFPQTIQPSTSIAASDQRINTNSHMLHNQQHKFQSFQQQDIGVQPSVQMQQQNQQHNPGMNSMNPSMSAQPSVNMRTQATVQSIIPQTSNNATGITNIHGIAQPEGTANTVMRPNMPSTGLNMPNQSVMPGSSHQMQGGARSANVRMPAMHSINANLSGNRPIPQNSNQLRISNTTMPGNRTQGNSQTLRTLLGPGNTNMQSNVHLRQQDNASLRPTVSNNMPQQQNYIMNNNNMMPGMQNQRNY